MAVRKGGKLKGKRGSKKRTRGVCRTYVVPTDKNISKLIRTDKQYLPGKPFDLLAKQNT